MGKSRKKYPEKYSPEWMKLWEEDVYRQCLLFGSWHDVDALYPKNGSTITPEVMRILVYEARKKGGVMDEITLTEETKQLLERRGAAGCVCCVYITSDFKKNGKLTDYPGNYPVEAKIEHVSAEKEGRVA